MNYVGFGRRLVALIIDGIVLWIVQIPINIIFPPFSPQLSTAGSDLATRSFSPNPVPTILQLVIAVLYWVVLQHQIGQTLGKKAMGIKVVDASGKTPSMLTFFLREVIGKLVSTIILFIGYLMVIWDGKKQALHDKIASTYVIKV